MSQATLSAQTVFKYWRYLLIQFTIRKCSVYVWMLKSKCLISISLELVITVNHSDNRKPQLYNPTYYPYDWQRDSFWHQNNRNFYFIGYNRMDISLTAKENINPYWIVFPSFLVISLLILYIFQVSPLEIYFSYS